MYRFDFNKVKAVYELTEMVRMFLPPSQFEIIQSGEKHSERPEGILETVKIPDEITGRDAGKRYIYDALKEHTGQTLKWGTLTGVRPVKLVGELLRKGNNEVQVHKILTEEYYLSSEKAELIIDIRKRQEAYFKNKDPKAVALYLGIPFCPTKCLYCSFPSYKATDAGISAYLDALDKEISAVGGLMGEKGYYVESVYIGGGTPTVLNRRQLSRLLDNINENFDLSRVREYTLEAGRPDTISREKLLEMKAKGVDRISINPQSTREDTLERIGRCHSNEELHNAFALAKDVGFKAINADLIAGLPLEEAEDFEKSLKDIIKLKPENITVHTLAVKRASKLKEMNPEYSYHFGKNCDIMLEAGRGILERAGYKPYYLYRQKQMMDNLENVGYSIPEKESLYNMRIMEEDQTIIALGAGAISKRYYHEENRLERIPNVSNFEIYIEKIDEMIERKRKGIG